MDDLEKVLISNKLLICRNCGAKREYQHSGIYQCPSCGSEYIDEFGKIKIYLEEHGPTPAYVISEATGIRIADIENFLKKGRLEVPEGSEHYIKCEKCGCDIRYGRFCPDCIRELSNGIMQVFLAEDIGEKPKKVQGKMRFLSRE